MKIVGGRFRGTQLASLSKPGAGNRRTGFRPTTGRVRENMFNLLLNSRLGDCIAGVRVLDAFAGSGALGLEALSRGAASVHFIDNDPGACAVIRRNIGRLRAPVVTRCLQRDALDLGPCPWHPFDLVFLDPPYRRDLGSRMLSLSSGNGWLADGAVVAWEEAERQEAPNGFEILDIRKYGSCHIHLLRWLGEEVNEIQAGSGLNMSTGPPAGRLDRNP